MKGISARERALVAVASDDDLHRRTMTRFMSRVLHTAPEECWVWRGTHDPKTGCPTISLKAGSIRTVINAQDIAYTLEYREAPGKRRVHTQCCNPNCVNPQHLFLLKPEPKEDTDMN